MNPLQQQIDAMQSTIAALAARVQALEGESVTTAPTGNAVDGYIHEIHERLKKLREDRDGPFALAVTNVVSQNTRSGSMSDAFSIVTVDKAEALASDETIEAITERARLLVRDTLALRSLRELLKLSFEGTPREATANELATRLNSDAAHVDAVLEPLVQNETLRRGLRADGTPFYLWDGNNHLAMTLLCRG